MKLVYVGYAVPKDIELSSKAVSVAGNNMETSLLKRFNQIYGEDFYSISIIPLASFPQTKKILVKKRDLFFEDNIVSHSVGFINIPFIKQLTIIISLCLALLKKIYEIKKKDKYEKVVVMTYNSASILSLPLFFLNRFIKLIKVCLVVDIPLIVQSNQKFYFKIARFIEDCVSLKLFKKYDAMITLVERTVLDFAPGVPYKLINYSLNKRGQSIFIKDTKINRHKIDIVFTGALEEYYGVKEMIELMDNLPSNYYLNLYGKGSLENYLHQKTLRNNRIVLHGLVENSKAIEAQINATVLLLIRTSQELNKYGLPSKIIEYLGSGTPIISTIIPSIPSDLNQFINFVEDYSPKSIANMVISITKNGDIYSEYLSKAKKGKDYILKNFTWDKQAETISEFLSEVMKNN